MSHVGVDRREFKQQVAIAVAGACAKESHDTRFGVRAFRWTPEQVAQRAVAVAEALAALMEGKRD